MLKRYSKIYNANKTLYPNLFSFIKTIPEQWIFNSQHTPQLRHPGAILNRATSELVKSFDRLLIAYTNLLNLGDGDKILNSKESDEILREQEVLFGHFDSFQDECYLILKSLCPLPQNDKSTGRLSAQEWLKQNDYECSANFLCHTTKIQKFIDCFSNRLKHGNQRLDFAIAYADNIIIPGFFIEELKSDEIQSIYKFIPRRDTNVTMAFSFNFTAKVLLLCFYELCDALEKVIKTHIKKVYNEKFDKRDIVKHSEDYLKVINSIVKMDTYLYLYEYRKFPKFIKSGELYTISYPHNSTIPFSGRFQGKCKWKGDDYTKTFHQPFFG